MNIPSQLQEQLAQMSQGRRPVRVRTVNVLEIDLEDGGTIILCGGTAEEALTESGIALATAQATQLPQSENLRIVTTLVQTVLVNGARNAEQRAKGPQLELATGARN